MAVKQTILGFKPQIEINDTPFAVTGGDFAIVRAEHEVGDSEDGLDERYKPGRRRAEVNMTFLALQDQDVHTDFTMETEDAESVKFEYFPNGRTDSDPYVVEDLVLSNLKFSWTKTGELTGTIAGKGGLTSLPSDA